MFRNKPAEELQETVKFLSERGPTGWIMGGMTEAERWAMIDGFQGGALDHLVCQTEAGGVGLNLVRAHKSLHLSIPFGYQSVTQSIGRLHRIGQEHDVTSYFAMTHPIAAFSRRIYDTRAELNEHIPQQIQNLLLTATGGQVKLTP
jgi:superfamily II DNA/RNA helicase